MPGPGVHKDRLTVGFHHGESSGMGEVVELDVRQTGAVRRHAVEKVPGSVLGVTRSTAPPSRRPR